MAVSEFQLNSNSKDLYDVLVRTQAKPTWHLMGLYDAFSSVGFS